MQFSQVILLGVIENSGSISFSGLQEYDSTAKIPMYNSFLLKNDMIELIIWLDSS